MLLKAIQQRWALLLVLLIFIIAKLPHLPYAYYWDESWVYAPCAFLMHAHGPSLLPDAIPWEYSKGHPLLFPAACAAWMDVFGTSHRSLHSFALLISALLIVAVHEVLLRLFGQRAALLGVVMLACNTFFYANSSALLADVLIALLSLLTLYAYAQRQYYMAALWLTLLVFTKESAIVVCAVLGVDIALALLRRQPTKEVAGRVFALGVPAALIAAFFVLQKHMLGWYLFPSHTSSINLDIVNTLYNLQRTLRLSLCNGLSYPLLLLLLPVTVAALRTRQYRYLAFIAAAGIVYLFTFTFSHKDAISYLFCAMGVAWVYWCMQRRHSSLNEGQQRFLKLCLAFAAAYWYFCCINFFEMRYVFPLVLILMILLPAVGAAYFIPRSFRGALMVVVMATVAAGIYNAADSTGEMICYPRMTVQQQVTDLCESNNLYDSTIYTRAYLQQVHLQDWKTGFLRSEHTFGHVASSLTDSTRVLIYDNIEPDDSYGAMSRNPAFVLLRRFENKGVWAEVYMRR